MATSAHDAKPKIHESFEPVLKYLFNMCRDAETSQLGLKYQPIELFVRGWFTHVRDGCRSILVLVEQGLGKETAPLWRSVIEHHVSLKWAREDGEAIVDTLGRGMAFGFLKTDKVDGSVGFPVLTDELIQEIQQMNDAAESSGDNLLNFAQRANKVKAEMEMAQWLKYTQLSHAGFPSALVATEDLADFAPDEQAMRVCTYLLWSLDQLNNMFEPMPWEGVLRGMVPRITAAAERAWR